ncbi:MAG: PHP-associated domain-containing protein [Nanoarchaeota archaeon]
MDDNIRSPNIYADLRAFFTIGFQDAPNGLWLGKHRMSRDQLPRFFYDTCMAKNIGLVALTSEDDKMLPHSPEDRFGHLTVASRSLLSEYTLDLLDGGLLRVQRKRDNRILLVLNSETVHAPQGINWQGLKLQVLGANRLTKNYSNIKDSIMNYNDQGLLTFLTGITAAPIEASVLDIPAKEAYGVITHDANNAFYSWMRHVPKLGSAIGKYTTASNTAAENIAMDFDKPGIAVSSAHFPHEMGRAGIFIPQTYLDLQNVRGSSCLLSCIRHTLDDRAHECVRRYNRPEDVLRFGYLLAKYGQGEDRFEGDEASSYNRKDV